ncbi:PREDICTED: uncharacterized protein LOC101302074 [Fragaria vesca subsp. vesca]
MVSEPMVSDPVPCGFCVYRYVVAFAFSSSFQFQIPNFKTVTPILNRFPPGDVLVLSGDWKLSIRCRRLVVWIWDSAIVFQLPLSSLASVSSENLLIKLGYGLILWVLLPVCATLGESF